MSSYIDLKFISEISARLGLFKKKSDYLYNFRCPHCGDSQKSKLKEIVVICIVRKTICFLNIIVV